MPSVLIVSENSCENLSATRIFALIAQYASKEITDDHLFESMVFVLTVFVQTL
jgi:hypothetical protein